MSKIKSVTPNHWVGMFDTAPIPRVIDEPETTALPIWAGKPELTKVPVYREPSVVEEFDFGWWAFVAATVLILSVLIAWWVQS